MKRTIAVSGALMGCLGLLLAACGGADTKAEPEPAKAETPEKSTASKSGPNEGPPNPPGISGPPKPWDTMTMEEKGKYMQEKVVPTMAPLFQAFDDALYSDFGCATCHGDDMQERNAAMPNPDLYALYPSGSPEQKQMVKERRPTLVFMFNKVVPHMRALLGKPVYDNDTGEGFSCYACHPKGESEAASLWPAR